jgi:hypothetical protein
MKDRPVKVIKKKTEQESPRYRLRRALIAVVEVLAEMPPKEAREVIQSVVK